MNSNINLKKAREVLEEIKSKHKPFKTYRLGFRSTYGEIIRKRNYNLTEKLLQTIENIQKKYAHKPINQGE